jgi:hypothetical protein
MALNEETPIIRTGIRGLKTNRVAIHQKALGIRRVNNPVLNYQVGSGYRAQKTGSKPPFDLSAIHNAYLVDA